MDKSLYIDTVRKYYPNAKTTEETIDRLLDVIDKKLGLKPDQLMHADSLCCDDVNAIQYPPRAYEMLGPFHLGGLNGFPFAGVTGMNAFAHHVPEKGAVFIFYAPHIGITKDGVVGEIRRTGQKGNSSCCGATQAALTKLMERQIIPDDISSLDYQMNTIEQIFLRSQDRIIDASNRIFEATEVMYEAIDERVRTLISRTNYPCKHVIIAGAIFINGDHDMDSFCSYRRFEHLDLKTKKRTNWMDDFLA